MDGKHDSSAWIACSHNHDDFAIKKILSVTSKEKKMELSYNRKVFGKRKLELSSGLERLKSKKLTVK